MCCRYRFKPQDEVRLRLLQDAGTSEVVDQEDLVHYLLQRLQTRVPPLKELCRTAIRTELRVVGEDTSIVPRVLQLPLPKSLSR